MNEKHKKFADYYIETLDVAGSYKKVYGDMTTEVASAAGCRLLKKVKVKEYIEKLLKSKEEKRIASQDEVLEFLTKTMRGEVEDQLGLETPVKERVRSAELLGKRYKMFTDKIETPKPEIQRIRIVNDLEDED